MGCFPKWKDLSELSNWLETQPTESWLPETKHHTLQFSDLRNWNKMFETKCCSTVPLLALLDRPPLAYLPSGSITSAIWNTWSISLPKQRGELILLQRCRKRNWVAAELKSTSTWMCLYTTTLSQKIAYAWHLALITHLTARFHG